MIENFETITKELTLEEMKAIKHLIAGFKTHLKTNPIKALEIIKALNLFFKENSIDTVMTEARLRKCCNYLRSNSILPLIATSRGYYVSEDKEEIELQIRSLNQRAASINDCANGLAVFLKS